MTIAVIKYNKSDIPGFDGVRCYADSLISSVVNGSELTKRAMKILPLPVKSQLAVCMLKEGIPETSIGFTFAGNLNVALLTYNTLSFFCSNIQRGPDERAVLPPSIRDIAFLCAQILYDYNLSYGEANGGSANTDILIFGYCFQEKQFKAFHIGPDTTALEFKINIKDVDICNIDYYAIGSGLTRLRQKVSDNGSFSYKLIKELIEENNCGVGGFYQRAWVSKGMIRLYADSVTNNPADFSFCGFKTIFPLGRFHFVGLPMHASED